MKGQTVRKRYPKNSENIPDVRKCDVRDNIFTSSDIYYNRCFLITFWVCAGFLVLERNVFLVGVVVGEAIKFLCFTLAIDLFCKLRFLTFKGNDRMHFIASRECGFNFVGLTFIYTKFSIQKTTPLETTKLIYCFIKAQNNYKKNFKKIRKNCVEEDVFPFHPAHQGNPIEN